MSWAPKGERGFPYITLPCIPLPQFLCHPSPDLGSVCEGYAIIYWQDVCNRHVKILAIEPADD